MSEKLKVQIFRDATATTPIDVSIAHEGLRLISGQNNLFNVINDDLEFPICTPDDAHLSRVIVDKIKLPLHPGIFNIVLTDKEMVWSDEKDTIITGFAQNRHPETGFAVVNATSLEPETTVAHEVGHLMGMRYAKTETDYEDHCHRPHCYMYGKSIIETVEAAENSPYHRSRERLLADRFCKACTEQLAIRAFVLLEYLAGKPVPKTWFNSIFFPEENR